MPSVPRLALEEIEGVRDALYEAYLDDLGLSKTTDFASIGIRMRIRGYHLILDCISKASLFDRNPLEFVDWFCRNDAEGFVELSADFRSGTEVSPYTSVAQTRGPFLQNVFSEAMVVGFYDHYKVRATVKSSLRIGMVVRVADPQARDKQSSISEP